MNLSEMSVSASDNVSSVQSDEMPSAATMSTEESCTSKIMIVDDEPIIVKVLRKHLRDAGYTDFVVVTDSTKAVATIYQEDPDILLLDIIMPGVNGLEILETLRSDERYEHVPVLILSAGKDPEVKTNALRLGAFDFLSKPVDMEELIPRVRNALLVKNHQDSLERKVRERTRQLEDSRQDLIHCLARAAEFRDDDTGRHVIRVGYYAGVIARELGLDDKRIRMIEQAATLHDVGKIGIPDAILQKPGKLSPEEFQIMQKHSGFGKGICDQRTRDEHNIFSAHTTFGAQIMSQCNSLLLDMASTIALTHHERWDGSGYPLGLAGEDIPLEGRITAVADVFDALSNKRPYKPAFSVDKCFAILEEGRDAHFEPRVVDAFFARKAEILSIKIKYAEVD